jgi:hypothetical protein
VVKLDGAEWVFDVTKYGTDFGGDVLLHSTVVSGSPPDTLTIEADAMSVKNWYTAIEAATSDALSVQHGQTAGNIVVIECPKIQLINPRYSDSDGIAMLEMDMIVNPDTGNDELKITVK